MNRIACIAALSAAVTSAHPATPLEHFGICNASAAVAVGSDHFLVADDDDNFLRLYRRDVSGPALGEPFDLSALLSIPGEKETGEADIEGAAQIGKRIYWIGSHGRNTKKEVKPKRRQFFATDLDEKNGVVSVTPVGKAYTGLLAALLDPKRLDAKYGLVEAETKAPEHGGLNIEGLAATPQGHLLLGFRSPLHEGKALIVPLQNPDALIAASGTSPLLGAPIELALGGRGIRSIDYAAQLRAYLIVAGPAGQGGDFKIYKWSGAASDAPVLLKIDISGGMHPEALFALPDGKTFQLLSDDGDGCKDKKSNKPKKFRSFSITVN